jgi:hypothetical protein
VFNLKHTMPIVNITTKPAATQSSSATSVNLTYSGTVSDASIARVFGGVVKPGQDNTCGTADDGQWTVGTGPGQVSGNSVDYTNGVKATGAFSWTYTAYNGVPVGGSPATGSYCMFVTAQDNAVDGTGAAAPNTTTTFFRTDVAWGAPLQVSFTIGLDGTYVHSTGFSTLCLAITTTPAQPSASYSANVTGPGVSGNGQNTGSLDAAGKATVKNNIVLFGSYNWNVTIGTTTASATTNVTATAGTCSGP